MGLMVVLSPTSLAVLPSHVGRGELSAKGYFTTTHIAHSAFAPSLGRPARGGQISYQCWRRRGRKGRRVSSNE